MKKQEGNGLDNLLITSFGVESSNPSYNLPSKIKIVMMTSEKPSFNLEVITEIDIAAYNPSVTWDVALSVVKEKSSLHFELIQQSCG